MKTTGKFGMLVFATAAGILLALSPAMAGPKGKGGGKPSQQVSLSPAESTTLTFMREEEKLARDVYLLMFDLWGKNVFSNIAASEQNHMDALMKMLDKYGLPDPILGEGEFSDDELQALYDILVAWGAESLEDALLVGAMIEEVDIEDLDIAIDESTKDDLDEVYANLRAGSVNHLKSFVALYEDLTGADYVAQYLPQDVVDELLASDS